MLPFINVFGKDIPMYGLLMVIGASLAIFLACYFAPKRNLVRIDVLLGAIFAFLGGLLGAKLLFIITDIPNIVEHFRNNPFNFQWLMHRLATSGIVFYGGLIGGFFGGMIYTRMFALDFWKHADAMIPYLPLAHAFGRIGCFCAGCCYGRPMDPPWGVYFDNAIGAPHGVALFPVQLVEAGFNLLVLFPLLLIFTRKPRKPGQVVGLYMICYGVFRFCNEYMRSDEIRGIFLGVSTSQWISLCLVPIGVILLWGIFADKLASKKRKVWRFVSGEYNRPDDEDEACEIIDEAEAQDETPCGPQCAVCTECGECAAYENDGQPTEEG